ncbi:MAG: AAA family ATPase [Leptolyngbya sp. SIO3F4]|nr:AAA family ATPase [Leptolyngbya sp. SIO3F4]
MKKIAVLSQKGGAGKTTLALHLAVAALLDDKAVAVIDLDPQASATDWGDSREEEDPVIVSAQAARLGKTMEKMEGAGADLLIIDTAPHSQNDALQAARAADLILIPCRPAILDLRAISNSVDISRLAKTPAKVVLNAIQPTGARWKDAASAIEQYEIEVSPCRLANRVAYQDSLTTGLTAQEYEPDGKASTEIEALYSWTKDELSM